MKCGGCGCTDDNACVDELGPCYWVGPEQCSACFPDVILLAGGPGAADPLEVR